jgi:hypothetical protein
MVCRGMNNSEGISWSADGIGKKSAAGSPEMNLPLE